MAFTASAVFEVQTGGVDDYNTVSAAVTVGGGSYAVNDVLTVSGGTSTTVATFTVTAVTAGVVTAVSATNTGHYTVLPANPVSVTGGGGTLCTLTVTWNTGGNGGGFDTGVAGFPTDGAATLATSSAPVFTSASYNFVAGDAGAWIYIQSGTSWTPGWYVITSVASNAATLNAAAGVAFLGTGVTPNTNSVAGCATVASPTGATWGIDYSQSSSARISLTDMVIDGTTNTKFTSSGNPVGKNFIGNVISVNAGSGFTVQRVAIVSTSGTTATCDKSLGTLSSTGGSGRLGGCLGTIGKAGALLAVTGMWAYVKSGTYTFASASSNVPGGRLLINTSVFISVEGYGTVRGDLATTSAPVLITTTALAAFTMINTTSGRFWMANFILDGASKAAMVGIDFNSTVGESVAYLVVVRNCATGFTCSSGNFGRAQFVGCTATANSSNGFSTGYVFLCEAYLNTGNGMNAVQGGPCLSYANTGNGIQVAAGSCLHNCISYGNGISGFVGNGWNSQFMNCYAEGNTGVGFVGSFNAGTQVLLFNCGQYNNSAPSSNTIRAIPALIAPGSSAFVNAAGGNFTLNSSGGALLRAAGLGLFPRGLTNSYPDIGAAQSRVAWQGTGMSGGLDG